MRCKLSVTTLGRAGRHSPYGRSGRNRLLGRQGTFEWWARFGRAGRPAKGGQRGQASVEWLATIGIVLLVMIGAVAALSLARVAPWMYGVADAVVGHLICAVRGPAECREDAELERAYGEELATQVRRYTPNLTYEHGTLALPVDFRACWRDTRCANGADWFRSVNRTDSGLPVTGFTRVIDRRGSGGYLYVQYWLYYADSYSDPSGLSGYAGKEVRSVGRKASESLNRIVGKRLPNHHLDDWESVQVRVDTAGRAQMRASSHRWYQGCKQRICKNLWVPWTGWSRVSAGSHAGHIVAGPEDVVSERVTPASALRLVPLETLEGRESYSFEISPPWRKEVYDNPESTRT